MSRYISVADTAKLIRKQLKVNFAGVKFSVRSRTYSGGASIDVYWEDGPVSAAVDKIVQGYRGSEFDGMIDLKTSHTSWLLPDGRACKAKDHGTADAHGSRSAEFNAAPSAGAEEVRFAADYIFCHRDITAAALARFKAKWAAQDETWRRVLMTETAAWREAQHICSWRLDDSLADFGTSADDVFRFMLRQISADTMEPDEKALLAARAHDAGWDHGGDGDGFWFHRATWGSWKAAASWSGTDNEPNGPDAKPEIYGSLAELCVRLEIGGQAHA